MTKSPTSSSAYTDLLKSIDSTSGISKLAKSLSINSAYADLFKNIDSTSGISKMARSLSVSSAYADLFKNIDSTSAISRMAGALSVNSAYADLFKNIDSTSAISRMAGALSVNSAYADLFKNIDSTSAISRMARSLSVNSAYAELFKSIDSTSSISRMARSITCTNAFYASIERLSKYEYPSNLIEQIDSESLSQNFGFDDSTTDQEVQSAVDLLEELALAESSSGFAKIWDEAPGWLKGLLVGFLVLVVWPLLLGATSGVMGNLITPYVQEYLDGTKSTTQREQLKGLKKLSFSELGIELRGFRFITVATLHLRGTPNARAPIIGELKFGQVVAVISYNLNWTEVLYEYGDGSTVTGWVFTGYTAKFRN